MILIIVLALLFTCAACGQRTVEPSDFFVIDKENIYSFVFQSDGIELKSKLKNTDSGNRYMATYQWQKDNQFYGITTVTKKDTQLLVRINTETLQRDKVVLPYGGLLTGTLDNDYFYGIAGLNKGLTFKKYDRSLKEIKTVEWYPENAWAVATDVKVIGDLLYVLTGIVPDHAIWGETTSHILICDKDFDLQKDIDLDYNNGGFISMAVVDNLIYITNPTEGVNADGTAGQANRIVVFSVSEGKLLPEKEIHVSFPYPKNIQYDAKFNNLIIEHDSDRGGQMLWTVLSLDDYSEHYIKIADYGMSEEEIYYGIALKINDGKYYLLGADYLLEYDPSTWQGKTYSLAQYEMNQPHSLVFRE